MSSSALESEFDSPSGIAAGLIGLAAAFLLCGYEFIRSSANTLFKETAPAGYGAENLPYVMAAVPVGILIMVYGYSWLLSRLGPRKTLLATSLLSALAIVACYAAISAGFRPARAILYVVRESYIVLLIEQYWSFLNSRLGTAAAKMYYGPICGMGSLGAIAGDYSVAHHSHALGTLTMVLFAAAAIVPATIFSDLAYARLGEPSAAPEEKIRTGDYLALRLFRSNALLVFLLLLIAITQVLATALDLSFQGQLTAAFPGSNDQNAYSGEFFLRVNVAAAMGQFLFTPLLLRYAPLAFVHAAIALTNLALCGYAWMHPGLASAGLALLAFKTMDYSVFRAAKEILYIPFSYDVRYRAKEVIDVWGYRFSKGGTALCIALMKSAGAAVSIATYAAIACGAAAVWLAMIAPIVRIYRRAASSAPAKADLNPGAAS